MIKYLYFTIIIFFSLVSIVNGIPRPDRQSKVVLPPPTFKSLRQKKFRAVLLRQGRIHFQYARELHSMGQIGAALNSFSNFLIIYPDHPWVFDALIELSDIQEKLYKKKEAIETLILAYKKTRNHERGSLAYLKAGKLFAEMGEMERAKKIFRELIKKHTASRISRLGEIELNALRFLDGNRRANEADRPIETEEKNKMKKRLSD